MQSNTSSELQPVYLNPDADGDPRLSVRLYLHYRGTRCARQVRNMHEGQASELRHHQRDSQGKSRLSKKHAGTVSKL
eukprot:scaffold46884_cov17-Tisochrysis_lutea.AAC.1